MKIVMNYVKTMMVIWLYTCVMMLNAQVPAAVPLPAPVAHEVTQVQPPVVAPAVITAQAPAAVAPMPATVPVLPVPGNPPAVIPAPVPAQPVTAPDNKAGAPADPLKKDFDEVAESLVKVRQLQDEIKTGFTAFDEKLAQARNIDVAIKEASFDLLKQDTEQKARELFAKMEGQLKELKEIQKFGQGDFMKKNGDKIAEITTLITKVNGIVQKLQSQVAAQPAAPVEQTAPQAQAGAQPAATAPQTHQGAVTLATQPVPAQNKTEASQQEKAKKTNLLVGEEQSLVSRAWQLLSDTVVAGIISFNRAVDWVTSWIKPQKKKVVKPEKKEVLSGPDIKAKTKECVETCEKIMKPLESQYFELVQKFQEVNKQVIACNVAAAKIPELREHLQQQAMANKISVPMWKRTIIQSFSKLIDLSIAIADAALYCIAFVYTYTLKPLVTMFRADVQQKIEMIEQGK